MVDADINALALINIALISMIAQRSSDYILYNPQIIILRL